jgi:hypothetical protein
MKADLRVQQQRIISRKALKITALLLKKKEKSSLKYSAIYLFDISYESKASEK